MVVMGVPMSSSGGTQCLHWLLQTSGLMSEVFAGRASKVLEKENGAGPGGLVERE